MTSLTPEQFLSFHQQSAASLITASEKITTAKSWQDKYRLLMQLGKQLPTLADDAKSEDAQVDGCESAAWLHHLQHDKQHFFLADSEARIVKGLIALLLAATNGKNSEQLIAFNAKDYFTTMGLEGQLSPSRSNGLYALAQRIKTLANT